MLSSVCAPFRRDIPQRVAILSLFTQTVVKKASLFRLLPLSVRDVLSIRSPVNFCEVWPFFLRRMVSSDVFDTRRS